MADIFLIEAKFKSTSKSSSEIKLGIELKQKYANNVYDCSSYPSSSFSILLNSFWFPWLRISLIAATCQKNYMQQQRYRVNLFKHVVFSIRYSPTRGKSKISIALYWKMQLIYIFVFFFLGRNVRKKKWEFLWTDLGINALSKCTLFSLGRSLLPINLFKIYIYFKLFFY